MKQSSVKKKHRIHDEGDPWAWGKNQTTTEIQKWGESKPSPTKKSKLENAEKYFDDVAKKKTKVSRLMKFMDKNKNFIKVGDDFEIFIRKNQTTTEIQKWGESKPSLMKKSKIENVEKYFDDVPKKKTKVSRLMNFMDKNKNFIKVGDNFEILIRNRPIPGSDLIEIMKYLQKGWEATEYKARHAHKRLYTVLPK